MNNRGFITIEASMVVPIFLFFMMGMAGIYMTLMAEAHIHQALAAATDYVAQYCYLEYKLSTNSEDKANLAEVNIENLIDTAFVTKQFYTYIGNDFYVNRMLNGGKNGILITVRRDEENSKILKVTATYQVKVDLPLLGTYSINLSSQIKQKAFVGFSKEEYINSKDCYVYITPNREAYHMRRDCTHLVLDIYTVSDKKKGNYVPCYYCGSGKKEKNLYVAKNGKVYHYSRDCIGLKRTVRRVKLSIVKEIGACTRCGGRMNESE